MTNTTRSSSPQARAQSRAWWLVGLFAFALWLWVSLPVALGEKTFFFRDVFANHLPLKTFGAGQLAQGRIPAFNPQLGMGQPFRGNPGALSFYPGNVLYLMLPLWSAFNLHFALHWLLAAIAMAVLARKLGQGNLAAVTAGCTYAGCGYGLAGLTFYNLLTVVAWWPLAMVGAAIGGARGIALGGLACGMALLGGEPMTAALALLPLILVAMQRWGVRSGFLTSVAIGSVGVTIALPQIVATARILPFSFRGTHGALESQITAFALHPGRLLELLIPLPFGWPLDDGPGGFWALEWAPGGPFFLSLYIGIVGLWLLLAACRDHRPWAALAGSGLLAAWATGSWAKPLVLMAGGLFRYPEKFLIWWAIAASLLVGWGLDRVLSDDRDRRFKPVLVFSALLIVVGVLLAIVRPEVVAQAEQWSSGGKETFLVSSLSVQLWRLAAYFMAAGIALGLAVLAGRRGWGGPVALLQVLCLVQLFPLLRTGNTSELEEPVAWERFVQPGSSIMSLHEVYPRWEAPPPWRVLTGSSFWKYPLLSQDLGSTPGLRTGYDYPLWPDIEGLSSPLHTFLTVELVAASWAERAKVLRALGVDALVLYREPESPDLHLLDRSPRAGGEAQLYVVNDPAPLAWWPREVRATSGPRAALEAILRLENPVTTVVASQPVEHDPDGRVRMESFEPDRIELEVESSGGGLVVIRRSFHTLYQAVAAGQDLEIVPVQLSMIGVVVPAGKHRVEIFVDGRPEAWASVVSVICLLAALVTIFAAKSSNPDPASSV